MNLRHATAADIPSMMAMERECPTAARWSEAQYRNLFVKEDQLVLIVEKLCDSNQNPDFSSQRTQREVGQPSDQIESAVSAHPPANNAGRVGQPQVQLFGFLVATHVAGEWELQNIVVHRSTRRAGLGMRLLEGLLAHANQHHGEAIFLEVRESNSAARNLYEKAGFAQVGQRNNYYSNPAEDAVLYRYKLA